MIRLLSLIVLVALVACSSASHAVSSKLNGVWQAKEPPFKLTIDLDAGTITSEVKGVTETKQFTVQSEDQESVVLRSDKGTNLTVRFVNDDVISWTLAGQELTLTRQK
jgi:hypothetical protein